MKHAMIATGAALLLAATAFTTSVSAAPDSRGARSGGAGVTMRGSSGATTHQFSGTRQFSSGTQWKSGVISGRHVDGRRHFVRRHFRSVPFVAFGAPYFYDYATTYYNDDSCYEWQAVRTRYGWRHMWVNVCYDYDY